MPIVKLTLFLRYADWLTCHYERFSVFVLQYHWSVLFKHAVCLFFVNIVIHICCCVHCVVKFEVCNLDFLRKNQRAADEANVLK